MVKRTNNLTVKYFFHHILKKIRHVYQILIGLTLLQGIQNITGGGGGGGSPTLLCIPTCFLMDTISDTAPVVEKENTLLRQLKHSFLGLYTYIISKVAKAKNKNTKKKNITLYAMS